MKFSVCFPRKANWLRSFWEETGKKSATDNTPQTLKQKSQSFSLTSANGLKPVSVKWLNPQVEGLQCGERYSAPFVTMLGKPLRVGEPPTRPPNIKLTHVSGTQPESSNFGGSIERQFSVFCLTGLSRIVVRWQITPPIHKDAGVALAIHYGLKAVPAWIESQW